jgi:hypothetical protein
MINETRDSAITAIARIRTVDFIVHPLYIYASIRANNQTLGVLYEKM